MKQRIYIIGAGVISQHHVGAFRALPREAELYAADPSPEARKTFSENFPEATMFESSDEMLAHAPADEFDIVVVSTPPAYHCSEAIKALQSGRHVVCEKPFAMNMEEARKMVDEARKLDLTISCCSNRFIGWSLNLKAKELVHNGEIGRPYLVDFQHRQMCSRTGLEYQRGSWWFVDKSKNGGGALMDWGPYDMSCLVDMFEPVKVTVSDAVSEHINVPYGVPDDIVFDIETTTLASLRFELANGDEVIVRYERTASHHGETYENEGIYFTDGYIKWNWLPFATNGSLTVRTTKSPALASEDVTPATDYPENDTWQQAPVRELDRYIRGDKNAKVLVNEKAIQPFSILRAIYDCAESGKPVELDFSA